MRKALAILLLSAATLLGQDSPALNSYSGPYRGPNIPITMRTLVDSLAALQARLLVELGDSTGVMWDSVLTTMAQIIVLRQQIEADSAALGDSAAALRGAAEDSVALLRSADSTLLAAQQAGDSTLLALHVADSLRMAADSVRLDSLFYTWGIAGDTTSPGHFYRLDVAGAWLRVGIGLGEKAAALAVDSVNKGAPCRFQAWGPFRLARWQGLWASGTELVNDSLTAGEVSPLDSTRSSTKKMQKYATAIDSATGEIRIDIDRNVWYWEN